MINSFSKWHVAGIAVFVLLFVAGCGGRPDIVNTKPAPDRTYSDAQVRQMTVDQPFWVSGDYFRKRRYGAADHRDHAAALEDRLKSKRPGSEKRGSSAGKPSGDKATLYAAATGDPGHRSVQGALMIKVGLLVDRQTVNLSDEKRLVASMLSLSRAYGLIPVTPAEIIENLGPGECISRNDLPCAARVISVFPGVRMLAVVKEFDLPPAPPATAHAKIAIMDTGLLAQYPPIKIEMAFKNRDTADSFTNRVISAICETALAKSRIMPWFCRIFASKNGTWFINAGQRSGLKIGDTLHIFSKGELVKTPTGLPAGWIPGDPKGILKIVKLFGKDLAACQLVSGQNPSVKDLLVK